MHYSALRLTTAIQQINHHIHNGRANPSHGKFFFVGSIPEECWDPLRNGGAGGSKFYPTEDAAIRAAVAAGAEKIQGADCRFIDPADYQ